MKELRRKRAARGVLATALFVLVIATPSGARDELSADLLTELALVSRVHVSPSGRADCWVHPDVNTGRTRLLVRLDGKDHHATELPFLTSRTLVLDDGTAFLSGSVPDFTPPFDLCAARNSARTEVLLSVDASGTAHELYRHERVDVPGRGMHAGQLLSPSIRSFAVLDRGNAVEISVETYRQDGSSEVRYEVVRRAPRSSDADAGARAALVEPPVTMKLLPGGLVAALWRLESSSLPSGSSSVAVYSAPDGDERFRTIITPLPGASSIRLQTLIRRADGPGKSYVLASDGSSGVLLRSESTPAGSMSVTQVAAGADAVTAFAELRGLESVHARLRIDHHESMPLATPPDTSDELVQLQSDGRVLSLIPERGILRIHGSPSTPPIERAIAVDRALRRWGVFELLAADDETILLAQRASGRSSATELRVFRLDAAVGEYRLAGTHALTAKFEPVQLQIVDQDDWIALYPLGAFAGTAWLLPLPCAPEEPLEAQGLSASGSGTIGIVLVVADQPAQSGRGALLCDSDWRPMDAVELPLDRLPSRASFALGERTAVLVRSLREATCLSVARRAEGVALTTADGNPLVLDSVRCTGGDGFVALDRSRTAVHRFSLRLEE